jgi:hypothetical protein
MQQQNFIGGLIAAEAIRFAIRKGLSLAVSSKRISLQPQDAAVVEEIVTKIAEQDLEARVAHQTNSEPVYRSRVSQGSALVIMTAITDIWRLWTDGIENTPMDYATPAIALISALWILYGRYVAKKPFGS